MLDAGSVWPGRLRTGMVVTRYEARVSMTFFGCGKKLKIIGLLFIGNLALNHSPCGVLTILSADGSRLTKSWEYFERGVNSMLLKLRSIPCRLP
jgi:hypothetical protein